ncbi:hypothetical protein [Niveispirillum sp.]|uniref:hypothetical protein n=1 Tax=Niveispirillum sp. TaxID=1917217 RepID=UPI001B6D188B|nr:hypothetical protein [Niveispirillum sp.]MBP7334750.1 hypothetical protein [Niveispirillum sp.]
MKNAISALILSTTLLLAAGPAMADIAALNAACGGVPAAPSTTKGDTADEVAMRAYGAGMRDYTARLMSYLTCLDNHPASAADMASASYRRDVINHRQQVADQLERTVTRFNAELREFKTRQAQVAAVP